MSCRLLILVVAIFLVGFSRPAQSAGEMVRLYDFGADEMGYLSLPDKPPVGSVLLVPEAYGSRQVVQQRCDLLAKLGYVALAVDLYNGNVSDNPLVALRMQNRLDEESAVRAVEAGLRLLHESPRYRTGKILIGVWGQNLPATVLAVANLESLMPGGLTWIEPRKLETMAEIQQIGAPLQVVMRGELDTPELDKILTRFSQSQGMAASVFRYEDKLGFMLEPSPSPSAVEAWSAVIDFWKEVVEETHAPEPVPVPVPQDSSVSEEPPSRQATEKPESGTRYVHPRLKR